MFYDRKIKYLDYMLDGERCQGAGFIKMEVRDDVCRMDIHVSGLHVTDQFERQVFLVGDNGESFLCRIKIVGGKGDRKDLRLNSFRMGDGGISYNELREIRIPIAAGRELRCLWKEKNMGKAVAQGAVKNLISEPPKDEFQRILEAELEEAVRSKTRQQEVRQKEYQGETAAPGSELLTGEILEESEFAGKDILQKEETGEGAIQQKVELQGRDTLKEAEQQSRDTLKKSEQHTAKILRESEFSEEDILQKDDTQGRAVRQESAPRGRDTLKEAEQQSRDTLKEADQQGGDTLQKGEFQQKGEQKGVQQREMLQEDAGQKKALQAALFPLEDKWKQLSAIYPHIAPFRDGREYLSLGPADFVIFPNRYYRLVNNSFLLHGYHNYEHLILARMERRGEIRYYIGVPGNFYEKEKQVAIMFGFESFECREEPARPGDYGYYMMRVEL